MSELENTTVETTVTKYEVTAAQRRQLMIRISDAVNNICHSDTTREMEDYARIGRLQAMLMGNIPFQLDGPVIKTVPLRERKDEKTYVAYFHGDVRNMRDIKKVLARTLMLEHHPHAMRENRDDKNDTRRHWSVAHVTKSAAHKIVEMFPELFTGVTFSDVDREDSGVKVEE